MATPPVNLGYGNVSDSQMNSVNQWMRSQPWYQELLQSWGQDPNNVHLSDSQKTQLLRAAQANGIIVNEGHKGEEIDNSGNFTGKGMSLGQKIAIGAAIGGLALTGLGAAGIGPLAGALGGGAGASAAGEAAGEAAAAGDAAAGVLPSTAIGTGMMGTEAGLSPFEAAAAESGMAAAGVAPLASTAIGNGMMNTPAGLASGTDAAAAGASSGGGFLSDIGKSFTTGGKVSNLLSGIGKGIGDATTAAGQNALDQEKLGLEANQQNISGEQAFIDEQLAMAKEEAAQRSNALRDVYRSSMAASPRVSPFDPVGGPNLSAQYLATAKNLGNQGSTMLANPLKYNAQTMPAPTPYQPIPPSNVQGATNTAPGVLQRIGQWAGPATSIASKVIPFFTS